MAFDRIIRFALGTAPSTLVIESLLAEYVGIPGKVQWSDACGRWMVRLGHGRVFEVFVGGHVNVITRHADEFTMAVADGFAAMVARRCDGKTELSQ